MRLIVIILMQLQPSLPTGTPVGAVKITSSPREGSTRHVNGPRPGRRQRLHQDTARCFKVDQGQTTAKTFLSSLTTDPYILAI